MANGLVNGLCGKVVNLNSKEIQVEVGSDDNLPHGMDGQVFTLEPIYFDVCDITGDIVATRYQFSVKLGYATTVDKAQGRTIKSLVVDCYNFWKLGQIGVAVGRCTNKDGLQIANYNVIASELKHPQVVQDFYQTKGKGMLQIKSCCRKKTPVVAQVHTHTLNFQVAATQLNLHRQRSASDHVDLNTDLHCPFNIASLVKEQLFPEVTDIQRH